MPSPFGLDHEVLDHRFAGRGLRAEDPADDPEWLGQEEQGRSLVQEASHLAVEQPPHHVQVVGEGPADHEVIERSLERPGVEVRDRFEGSVSDRDEAHPRRGRRDVDGRLGTKAALHLVSFDDLRAEPVGEGVGHASLLLEVEPGEAEGDRPHFGGERLEEDGGEAPGPLLRGGAGRGMDVGPRL